MKHSIEWLLVSLCWWSFLSWEFCLTKATYSVGLTKLSWRSKKSLIKRTFFLTLSVGNYNFQIPTPTQLGSGVWSLFLELYSRAVPSKSGGHVSLQTDWALLNSTGRQGSHPKLSLWLTHCHPPTSKVFMWPTKASVSSLAWVKRWCRCLWRLQAVQIDGQSRKWTEQGLWNAPAWKSTQV